MQAYSQTADDHEATQKIVAALEAKHRQEITSMSAAFCWLEMACNGRAGIPCGNPPQNKRAFPVRTAEEIGPYVAEHVAADAKGNK
jgi:hypothetical protein